MSKHYSSFSINGRQIGTGLNPYIIAEMSGNHNNSYEQAVSILHAAAACGVDALKLQTYTPNTITLKSCNADFTINNPNSLWYGKTLYDLYAEAHTDWDWVSRLFAEAKKIGLTCFSSVFDESAVDFLEDIGSPAYKISSFENNHIPLIKKAAKTGKPLIISTGASSLDEIDEAVETARAAGCKQLAILKCTSEYPADPAASNLLAIPFLRERFGCEVGLSDHTKGVGAAIASVAMGGSIIEKHFIIDRDNGGVDAAFSANKFEMEMLVRESIVASISRGGVNFQLSEAEALSKQFKRSIYAASRIKKGELFTKENIRIVRPGYGLHPRYFEALIGTKAKSDYEFADPIKELK